MSTTIIHMPQMEIHPNDENSDYIGDGAYAHKDKGGRLWVFTYDGEKILNKICFEHEVFDSLLRFYQYRILGKRFKIVEVEE